MSRPSWARRDLRTAIAIAAAAAAGLMTIGMLLLVIFLGAGGVL